MRSRVLHAAFVLPIVLSGAIAHSADGPRPAAPQVTARTAHGDLIVVIGNPNPAAIDIAYPLPLTLGPELGGVVLEFRRVDDAAQKPRRLCAAFDEGGIPARRPLEPGAQVEARWDLVLLGKLYCLDAGEHIVRVRYVDRVGDTVLATPPAVEAHVRIED